MRAQDAASRVEDLRLSLIGRRMAGILRSGSAHDAATSDIEQLIGEEQKVFFFSREFSVGGSEFLACCNLRFLCC